MDILRVNGRTVYVSDIYDFINLVRSEMGDDCSRYLNDYVVDRDAAAEDAKYEKTHCTGECDHTYRLQEHYECGLRDVLEDLQSIKGTKTDKPRIDHAIAGVKSYL